MIDRCHKNPASCRRLWMLVLGCLTAVLATSPPAMAADTLPIPDDGLTVAASTKAGSIHYGYHLNRWQLSGGLRYRPGPQGVELPLRVDTNVITTERYRLVPSVEVAPSMLFRGDTTPALRTRIGIDNRWIGPILAARIGVDVDFATTLSTPFDRRTTPALTAGLAHRFGWGDAWLTGRSGYTFAGISGGTITWELGVGITFSF